MGNEGAKGEREEGRSQGQSGRLALSSLADPRRVFVTFLATRTRGGAGERRGGGGRLAAVNIPGSVFLLELTQSSEEWAFLASSGLTRHRSPFRQEKKGGRLYICFISC